MSRIGKLPITVPAGVTVTVDDNNFVTVKGPKGSLSQQVNPIITLHQEGRNVTKFACVDGPDFNGYQVDFDEAMSRNRMYADFERHAYEKTCNLFQKEDA